MKNIINISSVFILFFAITISSFAQDGISSQPIEQNAAKNTEALQALKQKQIQEQGDKSIKDAQKVGKIVAEKNRKLADIEAQKTAEINKLLKKSQGANSTDSNYDKVPDLNKIEAIEKKYADKTNKVNATYDAKVKKQDDKNQKSTAKLIAAQGKAEGKLKTEQNKSTQKLMEAAKKSSAGNDKFIARENKKLAADQSKDLSKNGQAFDKQRQAFDKQRTEVINDAHREVKDKVRRVKMDTDMAKESKLYNNQKLDESAKKRIDRFAKNEKKLADKDLKQIDKKQKKAEKEAEKKAEKIITKKHSKEIKKQDNKHKILLKDKKKPAKKKKRNRTRSRG